MNLDESNKERTKDKTVPLSLSAPSIVKANRAIYADELVLTHTVEAGTLTGHNADLEFASDLLDMGVRGISDEGNWKMIRYGVWAKVLM